jgi:hypothetical protein
MSAYSYLFLLFSFLNPFFLSAQVYLSQSDILSTQGYAYTRVNEKDGFLMVYMNELGYGQNRTYVNSFHMRELDGEMACVAQEMWVHREYYRDYISLYHERFEVLDFLTFRDAANGVVIELSEPDKKGYFRIVFSKKPLKSKDQFALR